MRVPGYGPWVFSDATLSTGGGAVLRFRNDGDDIRRLGDIEADVKGASARPPRQSSVEGNTGCRSAGQYSSRNGRAGIGRDHRCLSCVAVTLAAKMI
jgi:hypothetical protein